MAKTYWNPYRKGANPAPAATAPVEDEPTALDDMTKDELLAEAERRGVDVAKSWTKGEILDALKG